jgi:hypothetical protein
LLGCFLKGERMKTKQAALIPAPQQAGLTKALTLKGEIVAYHQAATAAAEEAMAKAAKANADVVKTIAESELTQAKTAETLMKIDGGGDAPSMSQGGQMQAAPMQAEPPMMSERERLELEAMMIENAIRSRQLEEQEATLARVQEELAASQTQNTTSADMQQMVETLRERVGMIDETVARIGDAITEMAGVMRENADRAIAQISRPKRIVRERGRIARIEVE